jgi:hypothetical protein
MKAYGSGCIDPHFLTSALVGGEWLESRPGRYTPGTIGPQSRSCPYEISQIFSFHSRNLNCEVSAEAEETLLLEAVTRERLKSLSICCGNL